MLKETNKGFTGNL